MVSIRIEETDGSIIEIAAHAHSLAYGQHNVRLWWRHNDMMATEVYPLADIAKIEIKPL